MSVLFERFRTYDGSIDLCFNVTDILKLPGGKEIESGIRVKKDDWNHKATATFTRRSPDTLKLPNQAYCHD
jgi:hypothetical protein